MLNRASMGALAVALLAIMAAMKSYELASQQAPDPFGITAAQTRFTPAVDVLPASGVIGYLSDMPLGENVGSIAYMTAQYALAPRAIVPLEKSASAWAIGNFAHPGDFAERGAQSGYRIVRDFGNGVVVYLRAQ